MAGTSDLDLLRSYQAAFADSITEVAPDAPVASCGDWTVRDLVGHLSDVHTWAARRAGGPRSLLPPSDDLVGRYRAAATIVQETLASLDPDEHCWTLLDDEVPAEVPRVGTRRFWHRRQKLETLVHLWDLRTAGGLDTDASDAEWLDCVDEVLEVMQPRQLRLGRIAPPPVRLRLEPTGADAREGLAAVKDAPLVTVRGSAKQLALLVWGRADAADLDREGSIEQIAAALRNAVP